MAGPAIATEALSGWSEYLSGKEFRVVDPETFEGGDVHSVPAQKPWTLTWMRNSPFKTSNTPGVSPGPSIRSALKNSYASISISEEGITLQELADTIQKCIQLAIVGRPGRGRHPHVRWNRALRRDGLGGLPGAGAGMVGELAKLECDAVREGCCQLRAFASPMSSIRRGGLTGASRMRTSKGVSAFSTADITAAAAGMTPASPTPLTPSGLTVEGVS